MARSLQTNATVAHWSEPLVFPRYYDQCAVVLILNRMHVVSFIFLTFALSVPIFHVVPIFFQWPPKMVQFSSLAVGFCFWTDIFPLLSKWTHNLFYKLELFIIGTCRPSTFQIQHIRNIFDYIEPILHLTILCFNINFKLFNLLIFSPYKSL